MADLNKIVPAATLHKNMAFEQHELLRKALGGAINQLLNRMKEDGQTIKVAAKKINELGYEVSILRKDFAKNINAILAVQPESIVIEFARALVSANIQRRPAEPQWQDINQLIWQIVNDFNEHYSGFDGGPYYTPIDLSIESNKAKKPAIKLTEKKKKVKVVDGERSANDTVDLVAPPAEIEVGRITNPTKKVTAKKVLTFAIFPEGQKTENQELVLSMTNILTTRKRLESEPVQNILRLAKKYMNNPNKFAHDLINTFTKKHVSQKKFLELLPYLEKTNLNLVEASLILFGTNICPDPIVKEVPEKKVKEVESMESMESMESATIITCTSSCGKFFIFEVKEDSVTQPSKMLQLGQRISNFFKNLFSKGQ